MREDDVMTARRFRDLVAAYGADSARWPDDEREAALRFAADHADVATAWLDEARADDALLDLADVAQVSERLHYTTVARMIAANDVTGVMPVVRRRLPFVWATGAGLAACLFGAVVGAEISLRTLDDMRAQVILEQAQMIDLGDDFGNG